VIMTMPVRWLIGLTVAGVLVPVAAAAAEGNATWYGTLGIGFNYAEPIVMDDINAVIDYDLGNPAGALALGWNPAGPWRMELELSHQENKPEVWYFRGTDVEIDTVEDDAIRTTSVMLSAIRDFELGLAFRPYLGLGVGPARIRNEFNAITEDDPLPLIDDTNWVFAYQAMLGVTLPINQHVQLGMEYRYWRAPSTGLRDFAGNAVGDEQAIHAGWLRFNYQPGGFGWNPDTVARHPRPDGGNFYVAGTLGAGWSPDRDLLGTEGQFDAWAPGSVVSVALGYRLGRRWRLELDATRRRNDMQIFDTRLEETRTKGDARSDSLLANVVYRFRPDAAINPYLGGGFGVAKMRYDIVVASDRTPFINDKGTTHAFQVLMGFDVALTPRWTVTADYRFFFTGQVTITPGKGRDIGPFGTAPEPVDVTHMIHSLGAGIRYRLGG
jgi:opacity protein-like surface antigen